MKKIIMIGKEFGRLIVIKRMGRDKNNYPLWQCKCACGNYVLQTVNHLTTGNSKSCGCLRKELQIKRQTTHGKTKTLTYRIWQDMKDRCSNSKHQSFKNYGGRGILVCKRWLKFDNFLKDMGEKPEGLSIDRIKNNRGYYKNNCHWATRNYQSRNKRSNRIITFNGKTQCLSDWARELSLPTVTLWSRIYSYKFPLKKALTSKKYG